MKGEASYFARRRFLRSIYDGQQLFPATCQTGRPVRSITYPGPPDVGHSWAHLPDVGETMALLAERDASLAGFEVVHSGAAGSSAGSKWRKSYAPSLCRSAPAASSNALVLVGVASPFVSLMRELWEMRYLWHVPMRLDNTKPVSILWNGPHTPAGKAVRASLTGPGCLFAK